MLGRTVLRPPKGAPCVKHDPEHGQQRISDSRDRWIYRQLGMEQEWEGNCEDKDNEKAGEKNHLAFAYLSTELIARNHEQLCRSER